MIDARQNFKNSASENLNFLDHFLPRKWLALDLLLRFGLTAFAL